MGRGIAYPYRHHVIVDDTWFETADYAHIESEFIRAMRAYPIDKYDGQGKRLVGETDEFYLGIDYGGGMPALYITPKTYRRGENEKEYTCNFEVRRGFNSLISQYGELLMYWTTAYTAGHYGKQKDGSYIQYERKS